jgi:hypothetical protein
MLVAGAVGVGLVAGWVAARQLYRARWYVAARVLLGLVALGLVTLRLATLPATAAFAAALIAGGLVCLTWVRTLERRHAHGRE